MKTAIVILAGGSGTRLWPVSRNNNQKQFNSLIDDKTLLRNSYERILPNYSNEDIFISINLHSLDKAKKELPELEETNFIVEPKKMDRTAAFGLITLVLKDKGYESVILIACDDYIGNSEEYLRVLDVCKAINNKNPDTLLLVGMNPTFPATNYGYIEMGEPIDREGKDIVFSVSSFKEKPDLSTAEKFVADWKYMWNAGWFIFNLDFMIKTYEVLVPNTLEHLNNCYKLDPNSDEFLEEYSKCEAITFDIAIVEKLKNTAVLPASVGFSDIGSWEALKNIHTNHSPNENVVKAKNVVSLDTKGTVIYSNNKKKYYTTLGLQNIVIVDTEDALLVTTIDKSQDVKKIVEQIPDELK